MSTGLSVSVSRDLTRGRSASRKPEGAVLRRSIRTLEDAVEASVQVNGFCVSNGVDPKKAYHIALCTEELAANTILHGFSDGKKHHLELRAAINEGVLMLRLRDDCRRFDLV